MKNNFESVNHTGNFFCYNDNTHKQNVFGSLNNLDFMRLAAKTNVDVDFFPPCSSINESEQYHMPYEARRKTKSLGNRHEIDILIHNQIKIKNFKNTFFL